MALTKKQLKERKTGIGGSEAAYILGIGYSNDRKPFRTAHDVWLEKTGRKEPEDLSNNESVQFGIFLEPYIAKKYAKENQCKLINPKKTLRHPLYPWMMATPDRFIGGKEKILEIKTGKFPGYVWGESGSDKVPMPYIIQVQHYMAVTGFQEADIYALIYGAPKGIWRTYTIKRDDDIINHLIERLGVFWNECVLKDMPPQES